MEFKSFKKHLKQSGHFTTKPRMQLFGFLQNHPALSVKELLLLTTNHDQATTYRNLSLFEELGIINKIQLGWHTRIELSEMFHSHHHHLTCLQCDKVFIIEDDYALEKHISALSASRQFKAVDHQLEIRGYCQTCRTK
ncbi:MAG: transcriptional repressor [bacterium]|nr:transcriptional repressor [bacterium]